MNFIISKKELNRNIYFLLKKPISARSGKNQTIVDYIFGVVMIMMSLLILTVGLGFLY